MRNLVLVLGDQLNVDSAAFDGFDRSQDGVWMVEVAAEARQANSFRTPWARRSTEPASNQPGPPEVGEV